MRIEMEGGRYVPAEQLQPFHGEKEAVSDTEAEKEGKEEADTCQ